MLSYQVRRRVGDVMCHQCAECGAESRVWVEGEGAASGRVTFRSLLVDEEPGLEQRALEAAGKNVDLTLAQAPCPACGHRSSLAWLRARAPALVVGIVLVASGFALAFHFQNWFAVLLFGVGLPAAAYRFWCVQRWKWETVNERVHVMTDEDIKELENEERARSKRDKRPKKRRRRKRA